MSELLIAFLENEVKEGRMCNPLHPLQAGTKDEQLKEASAENCFWHFQFQQKMGAVFSGGILS